MMPRSSKKTLTSCRIGKRSGSWSSTPTSARSYESPTSVKTMKPPIPSTAIPWPSTKKPSTWFHPDPEHVMERPHQHDYKKGKQHLGISKAQPVLMPQTNRGDLLQVPGQAAARIRLHKVQHQCTGVQRRAARFVSGNYRRQASVGAMLQSLGWETLQQRRRQAKAVMMYKIINNCHWLITLFSSAEHIYKRPLHEIHTTLLQNTDTEGIILPHRHLQCTSGTSFQSPWLPRPPLILQDQSNYHQPLNQCMPVNSFKAHFTLHHTCTNL